MSRHEGVLAAGRRAGVSRPGISADVPSAYMHPSSFPFIIVNSLASPPRGREKSRSFCHAPCDFLAAPLRSLDHQCCSLSLPPSC